MAEDVEDSKEISLEHDRTGKEQIELDSESVQLNLNDVAEDFPDGGFRAWLIVFGVRTTSPIICGCYTEPFFLGDVYDLYDVSPVRLNFFDMCRSSSLVLGSDM